MRYRGFLVHKMRLQPVGSAPDPAGEAYSAPQIIAGFPWTPLEISAVRASVRAK